MVEQTLLLQLLSMVIRIWNGILLSLLLYIYSG